MKRFLLVVVLLLIAGLLVWKFAFQKDSKSSEPGPEPLAVSKHSAEFNQSMQAMMSTYYQMSEALVNWDSAAVNASSSAFKSAVDSLRLDEMKKDSALYPTVNTQWEALKTEIEGLISDQGWAEKRASFNMLSQQVFDLLRIVRYDVEKVYFQECPMALNNYETSAYWLSKQAEDNERRNPYLGLKDPKYGKGMLKCGETRDSINYVSN